MLWRGLKSLLGLLLTATVACAATPAEALAAALADARLLTAEARTHTRYLSLYATPEKERTALLQVLGFQVNSLSNQAEIVAPRRVTADLVAVMLDDYGLDPKTWEKLAAIDPYFHALLVKEEEEEEEWGYFDGPGKTNWRTTVRKKTGKKKRTTLSASAPWLDPLQAAELITLTQSQAPVVRGDWFFVQSARQLSLRNQQTGVGYYDWLKLKKRDDLFKLVKFSEKDAVEIQAEVRAALDHSGVSQQNRQIVRFAALTGGLWITLDTNDEGEKGNAVANLKKGDYVHQAEEIYAANRNGLPVYWAGAANGDRQDSAPDFIGPDDSPGRVGRDGRIHVCLACIRCHAGSVLKPIDDWARRTYTGSIRLQSPDYATLRELRRQYLSNLDGYLSRDREAFTEAVTAASGLPPGKLTAAYATAWNHYVEETVGLDTAALDLGCTAPQLKAALLAYAVTTGGLDTELLALAERDQKMPRVHWEERYSLAQTALKGYIVP